MKELSLPIAFVLIEREAPVLLHHFWDGDKGGFTDNRGKSGLCFHLKEIFIQGAFFPIHVIHQKVLITEKLINSMEHHNGDLNVLSFPIISYMRKFWLSVNWLIVWNIIMGSGDFNVGL